MEREQQAGYKGKRKGGRIESIEKSKQREKHAFDRIRKPEDVKDLEE